MFRIRAQLLLLVASIVLSLCPGATAQSAPAEQTAPCQFRLGFQALHGLIPDRVGRCQDDESHNPENGDGLQHTTAWHGKGGLLVWRKADNWTAFTDGSTTWINGPNGVQSRPNQGPCFAWEACPAAGAPAPAPTPALAAAPAPAAGAVGLPFFGVYLAGQDPAFANRAAGAGAGFASVQVRWDELQPSAGMTSLEPGAQGRLDAIVAALRARGVVPVGIIGGAPGWAAFNAPGPLRPGQEAAFTAFVRLVVARYSAGAYGVHHWFLWPEADAVRTPPIAAWADRGAWGDDPAAFAALLKATYPVVKAADPTARVILGPLAHDFFYDPRPGTTSPATGGDAPGFNQGGLFKYDFLDKVLDAGAGGSFDALGLNAYLAFAAGWEADARRNGRAGADVAAKIGHVRARLAAHGLDVPIVVGESGFWSAGGAVPLTDGAGTVVGSLAPSPEVQAAYVAKLYARARDGGAAAVAWFTLNETGERYGLLDETGAEKPAYAAYRTAAGLLGPVRARAGAGGLVTLEGKVESYAFAVSGGEVAVAWATGSTAPAGRVAVPAGTTAADLAGRPVAAAGVDGQGRPTYTLGSSPVFFRRSA